MAAFPSMVIQINIMIGVSEMECRFQNIQASNKSIATAAPAFIQFVTEIAQQLSCDQHEVRFSGKSTDRIITSTKRVCVALLSFI